MEIKSGFSHFITGKCLRAKLNANRVEFAIASGRGDVIFFGRTDIKKLK